MTAVTLIGEIKTFDDCVLFAPFSVNNKKIKVELFDGITSEDD